MTAKPSYGDGLFLVAYTLCLLDAILIGYSTFAELAPAGAVSRVLIILAAVMIVAKLCTDRYYNVSDIVKMVLIGGLLFVVYLRSGYNHILYLLLVVLGIRNISTEHILRIDFFLKLILIALIVLSSSVSVISNYIMKRTGSEILRFSMGFNHPNTLASMMLSLVLEEAILSRRSGGLAYTLIVWSLGAVVLLITNNRTAILLMFVFPVLLSLLRLRSEKDMPVLLQRILQLFYPVMMLFSWLCMLYSRKSRFFSAIDAAMSYRYYNCLRLYNRYGIDLLGQRVKLVSVKTARETGGSIALLDVSFLRALIQCGPGVIVVLAYMYWRLFRDVCQENDRLLCLVTCLFLAFGLCESGFNNVYLNFTLLFAASSLYEKPLPAGRA